MEEEASERSMLNLQAVPSLAWGGCKRLSWSLCKWPVWERLAEDTSDEAVDEETQALCCIEYTSRTHSVLLHA